MLDRLVTSKQDVVDNFNWLTLVGSKLIVFAVVKAVDLSERAMCGRVHGRLGTYSTILLDAQLTLLQARVESAVHHSGARPYCPATANRELPEGTRNAIAPDGIKFACMKASSISSDARRALDVCRRAVEIVQAYKHTARTDSVKQDMQNSRTATYMCKLPLHERLPTPCGAVTRC